MVVRKTKIWAFVAVFVVGFVACNGNGTEGSDSETNASPAGASANEYVSTLCAATSEWLGDVQELQAQVQASIQPGAEPSEAQQALRTFFDNTVSATNQLLGAVEGVGPPDVSGGAEVHNEISTRFEEVRDALEQGRSKVEDLPVDDREAFITEAGELRESVQSQLQAIGKALAQLSQPDLDAAAAEEPDCTGLSPTGG